MEKGLLSNINENQLRLLLAYNKIHENPKLVEMAEKIKNLEIVLSKDDSEFRFISENKDIVQDEINKLIESFSDSNKKKVRVYVDGVFDIIHSGHFNAIRQAKKLGDELIVGVNSDEDVLKAKGPTLMNCKERGELISACKWVDTVVLDTPYTPTIELIDELNCDYCAHGDDIAVDENGVDVYSSFKKVGRMKIFKRTEGISTTDIIGRLLNSVKYQEINESEKDNSVKSTSLLEEITQKALHSKFLATSKRISDFSSMKTPKPNDKIVYVDGSWDILHVGHIDMLKKAKQEGDFLYVGVHDDNTVREFKGYPFPLLNLQERIFNLLALRYVDEVVIGAPWVINHDMINNLKINTVVISSEGKDNYHGKQKGIDSYGIPRDLGILKEIESTYSLSNEILVQRLLENQANFQKKFQNRSIKEKQYYENKTTYLEEI